MNFLLCPPCIKPSISLYFSLHYRLIDLRFAPTLSLMVRVVRYSLQRYLHITMADEPGSAPTTDAPDSTTLPSETTGVILDGAAEKTSNSAGPVGDLPIISRVTVDWQLTLSERNNEVGQAGAERCIISFTTTEGAGLICPRTRRIDRPFRNLGRHTLHPRLSHSDADHPPEVPECE